MATTYSFTNISMVLSHPGVGEYTINESGVGNITVSAAGDVTAHNVAADGHVMVSKMKAPNGTITIEVQQVSEMNTYLKKWYNFVNNADTDQWIAMIITVRDATNGFTTQLMGVSPQTVADETFQAEGQMVTWTLMAAEVVRN